MLYKKVDACDFCRQAKNPLQHIHGVGARKPRYMLVLINPTYKNISSAPGYGGPRFPFVGLRQFWNILGKAGLIQELELPSRSGWQDEHTQLIQKEIKRNRLFITNIVKCCYDHPDYPAREVIEHQKDILKEEIRIIQPRQIIAFGALTFKALTGLPIKLSEYWSERTQKFSENISGLDTSVIPCYFPIGRGSPQKATKALQTIYA